MDACCQLLARTAVPGNPSCPPFEPAEWSNTKKVLMRCDRIPSTTPGAEPPRDAKDSGSAT